MKHSGKASLAALRLIALGGAAVIVLLAIAFLAKWAAIFILRYLTWALVALWGLFTVFTFYFFRDPDPLVPAGPNLVISPGHGKVDVIDVTTEPDHLGGECQRISIFLSVFDIHVQNAPVTGRVAYFKRAVTRARENRYRIVEEIGGHQVQLAVAMEIRRRDGP